MWSKNNTLSDYEKDYLGILLRDPDKKIYDDIKGFIRRRKIFLKVASGKLESACEAAATLVKEQNN